MESFPGLVRDPVSRDEMWSNQGRHLVSNLYTQGHTCACVTCACVTRAHVYTHVLSYTYIHLNKTNYIQLPRIFNDLCIERRM